MLHALTQCPWVFGSCAVATAVKTIAKKMNAAAFVTLDLILTLSNATYVIETPWTGICALVFPKVAIEEIDHDAEGFPRFRCVWVVEEAMKHTIPHMQLRVDPRLG